MLKNFCIIVKDFFVSSYKIIKNTILCISFAITSVFKMIKGFFIAIKSIIDFIYKCAFIAFIIAIGYFAYIIYNNAMTINNKLDNLLVSMQSISSFLDKGNTIKETADKTTKNIINQTSNTAKEVKNKGNNIVNKIKKYFSK